MAHNPAPEILGLPAGTKTCRQPARNRGRMKGSAFLSKSTAAISGLLLIPLLLLCAACDLLEQNPPPNIPATVAAEVEETAATVVAEVEETASAVAEEVEESAATVTALLTPEPPPPTIRPTPTPEPTPAPSPTPTTAEPVATGTPTPPAETPTATPPPPTVPLIIPTEVHTGEITTSLGKEVDVAVSGFDSSFLPFEQLELAINEAERLLGVPYPSPRLTFTRVAEVPGGFCGSNQMSYAPGLVGDPNIIDGSAVSMRLDDECNETFRTIAHEVAHTWFHGNDPADWIDEGLANAIEDQVARANQQDRGFYPPVTYCESHLNLSELEQGEPARINEGSYSGYACHYSLGDGIFDDLREYHGDSEFNQRIARLARRSENETNLAHTIDDIRTVLGGDPTALEIINRWYEGQPEMRKFRHLDSVEWIFPPTIDGDYLHFSGKIAPTDAVHDFELGDTQPCSQFSLREGIAGQEWVDNVSRPLSAGRTHHQDSKVITINHDIDPGSGEFLVTARILDGALAGVRDLTLSVNERVDIGADELCGDSITYAQIQVVMGNIPTEMKQARYYHLDAVDWSFTPTIDGEYLHFAGKTSDPGLVHNFVLGSDSNCSQFTLYRDFVNQERVATVAEPLPVGWSHDEIPQVVVINDVISPATGEFSVTARIHDPALSQIPGLSLAVSSRTEADANNICGIGDSYSQVAVSIGQVPSEFKVTGHYHADAIQWTVPPATAGNMLSFAGRAAPGAINLDHREGYCVQLSFYQRDERGYHFIDSLNPFLPGNQFWSGPITGEITNRRIGSDGTFEATASITENALTGYQNVVLVVTSIAAIDPSTGRCDVSEVLSAVDILP